MTLFISLYVGPGLSRVPNPFSIVPHGISVEFRNNVGCGKTLDLDRLFTETRGCGCVEGKIQ